jgi:methylglutaconyl-CoA hydratase
VATTSFELKELSEGRPDRLGIVTINRPDAANAFNESVLEELTEHFTNVGKTKNLRGLIVRSTGKHFSAGADLSWMKESAKLSLADNLKDAKRLTSMFESLANLPIPTIALVQGAVYGGAVGLVAACDFALAQDSAKFCLSEVRLGLLPAVILPYLARKMSSGDLKRLGLSARVFSAGEALRCGLVQRVAIAGDWDSAINEEVSALLTASPEAQAKYKSLLNDVESNHRQQGDYTAQAIANIRVGASAQAGLSSFFEKKPTPWAITLPKDWTLG